MNRFRRFIGLIWRDKDEEIFGAMISIPVVSVALYPFVYAVMNYRWFKIALLFVVIAILFAMLGLALKDVVVYLANKWDDSERCEENEKQDG